MADVPEDMVERVAKAIWEAKIAPGGGGRTMMPWPFCPEHDWCVATARAAIEAIPVTDDMVRAAEVAVYGLHERGFIMRPLIDPIDMRKALEAAMIALTAEARTSLSKGGE